MSKNHYECTIESIFGRFQTFPKKKLIFEVAFRKKYIFFLQFQFLWFQKFCVSSKFVIFVKILKPTMIAGIYSVNDFHSPIDCGVQCGRSTR